MLLAEHPLQLSTSLSQLSGFGCTLRDSTNDQSSLSFWRVSIATNGKDLGLRESTGWIATRISNLGVKCEEMTRLTIAFIGSTVDTPALDLLTLSSIPTRSVLKLLQHSQNNLSSVLTVRDRNHL